MSYSVFFPRYLRLVLAITLVHVIAWFAYYSQIPAGQFPNDATRISLQNAQAIANGSANDVVEYSLYTYTLSVLAHFFQNDESLTSAARILNGFALMIATGFTASAAGHYWRRNRAILIAGLLVGLNPVLVFWASEISPSLLTTACMSFALWRMVAWLRHPKFYDSLGIAISLVLAASFETSLLPLALLLPALAYAYPQRQRILHFALAFTPAVIMCALILVSKLQLQDSLSWDFNHLGQGIYQTLGNVEAYDDKSFGLYRQLHFILLMNPIHWGALLTLAGIGMYLRIKDGHRKNSILLAIGVIIAFAIGHTLNDSGSQARVSLIPLLALFAAGIILCPKIWKHASKRTHRKILAIGILLSAFAYTGHFTQKQSNTWERDYVYLANANLQFSNNDRAATWAEKALELNPERSDMQQILVLTTFNDWATGDSLRTLPVESVKTYLESAQSIKDTQTTQVICSIYQYKLRKVDTAQAVWHRLRAESALALLCLYWTGNINTISPSELNNYSEKPYYDLLKSATEIDRNALTYSRLEKQFDNLLAFAY